MTNWQNFESVLEYTVKSFEPFVINEVTLKVKNPILRNTKKFSQNNHMMAIMKTRQERLQKKPNSRKLFLLNS